MNAGRKARVANIPAAAANAAANAAENTTAAGRASPRANPLMPGLRIRHDGWTADRTRVFLAVLGQTGCVRDAARVAGLSSTNAYRQKARFPLFAAEWAKALARATRALEAIAWQRAVEGKETVIIRGGKEVERRITPDSSILALLLKRGVGGDISAGAGYGAASADAEAGAEGILTRQEYADGWRFNDEGRKYNEAQVQAMRDELHRRLELMRHRMAATAHLIPPTPVDDTPAARTRAKAGQAAD